MSPRTTRIVALLGAALMATAFVPGTTPGAEQLAPAVPVADSPLVADAGSSLVLGAGERGTFHGAAYGGTAPYTFSWSAEGVEVVDPANPVATVVPDGSGRRTLTLTVTDADGDTDTDTIPFVVVGAGSDGDAEADASGGAGDEVVLLDETVTDTTPGVVELTSYDFEVEVPEGLRRMDVVIEWSVPANDYDLRVFDPEGTEVAFAGSAPPATSEAVGVTAPAPGTYVVSATHFANTVEPSLRALVTGVVDAAAAAAADGEALPTVPSLDVGGPYAFRIGQQKRLRAEVEHAGVVAWDLDQDGITDVRGRRPVVDLPVGNHLVTAYAVDADGFRTKRTTSVRVGANGAELAELAAPVTVIGIADSGINPYHAEFSAATYPDPELLALTRGFTIHPSEYIPGYPEEAQALPITTGQGYYPDQDQHLWSGNETIEAGQLYWIPGTKIIGAIDDGGSTGATSGADGHPILDDNGHGTGSSSVAAGNRYGYCPTCLLVHVEALNEDVVAGFDWVDLSSNSFGAIGGVPLGLLDAGGDNAESPTRVAAERGQLTFFSAGNGTGNAFATTPILTHGSDPNGGDWVITVGATREDNQGAIVSDGFPVHISALGDGDLPSACRTGVTGQCMFGGTSAASPYTAGAFGAILTAVRDALGDPVAGQRPGQVVAEGRPVPGSPYLSDGQLTRAELRAVGLKTAAPRSTYGDSGVPVDTGFPFPWTYSGPQYVWFEGYGSSGPAHAARAVEVLLGEAELPDRSAQDEFFAMDCDVREGLYGGYDRDGDGEPDTCVDDELQTMTGTAELTNDDPRLDDLAGARQLVDADAAPAAPVTYFLHRQVEFEPDRELPPTVADDPSSAGTGTDYTELVEDEGCDENFNEFTMSPEQEVEDALDLCFDTRITTNLAPFRVRLNFPATEQLDGALPAGSTVSGTVFLQTAEAGPTGMTIELKATDRVVASSGENLQPLAPMTWTPYEFEFTTDRPVAPGEQLSLNVKLGVARAYALGYQGDHASSITITPGAMPQDDSFAFGVGRVKAQQTPRGARVVGAAAVPDLGADPQLAGFHDTVVAAQVATDRSFTDAVTVEVDRRTGAFRAVVPDVRAGTKLFVRPLRDRVPGAVATVRVKGFDGRPVAPPRRGAPAGQQQADEDEMSGGGGTDEGGSPVPLPVDDDLAAAGVAGAAPAVQVDRDLLPLVMLVLGAVLLAGGVLAGRRQEARVRSRDRR